MDLPDPVLTVLLFGTIAAAASALGALPFAVGPGPRAGTVGAAYALASGFMLGAGYLLMSQGLESKAFLTVLFAGLGVAYTWGTQAYAGTDRLETPPDREIDRDTGYQAILQSTLHSAAEGVAIGVAMVVDLSFGIFLALALAVHNIGEAMALTAILRRLGMTVRHAAGLCVVSKVTQPLLAIFAFALAPTLGDLQPAALGFAAGALVFLVFTELAPASYTHASRPLVATLMSIAAAAVVFFEHLWKQT